MYAFSPLRENLYISIDQYEEVEVQTELVCILRTYIFHIQEQGMQGPFKID